MQDDDTLPDDASPELDRADEELPQSQEELLPVDDDGNVMPGADEIDDDPNDNGDLEPDEITNDPADPLDPMPDGLPDILPERPRGVPPVQPR